MVATAKVEEDYDIQQLLVTNQNPFCNMMYGDTLLKLKQQYNVVPIGLVKLKDDERILYKLPEGNTQIEEGDYIIVIVSGVTAPVLSQIFGVQEGIIQSN